MVLHRKGKKKIEKALAQVDDKAEPESYTETSSLESDNLPPLSLTFFEGGSLTKQKEAKDEDPTIQDFAKVALYEDFDDTFSVLNSELSIGSNVALALKTVTLGLTDWEYKFLASYACLASVLCRILPIVEIYGQAGSGKSQLLIAIGKISDNGVISGQSTGASLKNYINAIRWCDPETKRSEKNCLLLIDNLTEDSFKKEEYLSSFLNGYNRATDRTFISNGRGENIEFKTFCGKIYTTVWEKHSTELSRRTITIRTQKSKELDSILDPDEICFSPLTKAIKDFWNIPDSWVQYKLLYKRYNKLPKPGSKECWTLFRDVLVTGVICGVFTDLETAITETWMQVSSQKASHANLTEVVVIRALESILGFPRADWEEVSKNFVIAVAPRQLKDAIEQAVKDGLIDRPKLSTVQQLLTKLGFGAKSQNGKLEFAYRGNNKNER